MAYRAEGRAAIGPGVPGLDAFGQGRLRALVAYGRKVFDLREGFESVRDKRREPKVTPAFVAAAVFFCGLLRTRSFNARSPNLEKSPFVD